MTFPLGYPATHSPTFQVSANPVTEMPPEKLLQIVEGLNNVAKASLARGVGKKTISSCLRYLVLMTQQRNAQYLKKKEAEVRESFFFTITEII